MKFRYKALIVLAILAAAGAASYRPLRSYWKARHRPNYRLVEVTQGTAVVFGLESFPAPDGVLGRSIRPVERRTRIWIVLVPFAPSQQKEGQGACGQENCSHRRSRRRMDHFGKHQGPFHWKMTVTCEEPLPSLLVSEAEMVALIAVWETE